MSSQLNQNRVVNYTLELDQFYSHITQITKLMNVKFILLVLLTQIWNTNTNVRLLVTPGCDWHQLVNADPVSAIQCTEQSRSTITIQDVRVSPELGQETSHCLSTSRQSSQHQWSQALAISL